MMQDLAREARAARADVRKVVDRKPRREAVGDRAKRTRPGRAARARGAGARIEEKIARLASQASRSATAGRRGGFLGWPVPGGYVTSPYGFRTHPIYGYDALHNGTDFGAGCGVPLWRRPAGTVRSKYYSSSYGNRLIIYLGKVNGVASRRLQPRSRLRVDVGSASRADRSSATPATPAGRPAATCTSRCWRTVDRSTR